jgi:glucosamine kinase
VGTGSVGLARRADGSYRSVGGWGFPSGDEGSGAWLGLHAANLAQQRCDGRLIDSPLADAVLQACGGTPEALLEWCCQAGQAEFASLAPQVFACAGQDPLAAALLTQALHCMEQMLQALDPATELPLALMGSIAQLLAPRLVPATQARVVPPRGDAMDGALSLLSRKDAPPTPT